jgi:hypothetical protein
MPLEARCESGGFWLPWERRQILALKEPKAVQHGLQENLPFIQAYKDNVCAYYKTTQTLRHA